MNKQNIDNEHINDPLLMETLKGNPFLVPEDYFVTLQEEILLKKRISELEEPSYVTPKGYQDSLRQDILSRISEQKLKEKLPHPISDVPAGYFEDLQKRILNQTVGKKAEEGISIEPLQSVEPLQKTPVRRLGIRKWIPYASAAAIAIAISVFAVVEGVKTSQHKKATDYAAKIEIVSTDEIINFLASYSESGDLQHLSNQLQDRTDDIVDDLTEQEIEAYLEYSL